MKIDKKEDIGKIKAYKLFKNRNGISALFEINPSKQVDINKEWRYQYYPYKIPFGKHFFPKRKKKQFIPFYG